MPWLERIVSEEPRVRFGSPIAYLIAIGLCAAAVVPRLILGDHLLGVPFLTFFPAILLSAFFGGLGSGLLAVTLRAIAAWIVLIPPYWTLLVPSASDALAIALFVMVSIAICLVVFGFQVAVTRLRQARMREEATTKDLERQVQQRTAELQASEQRLRAIFETSYQYQGFMTPAGILLDANATSLAGIKCSLKDVAGKLFCDTPWFTGTPGMPDFVRNGITTVADGKTVRQEIRINLTRGWLAVV